MTKQRAIVLIDGSNFYNSLKKAGVKKHKLDEFDYKKFADSIAGDCKIIRRSYYTGVVRAEKENVKGQQLRTKQQQLFSHLTSSGQKFNVVRGELKQVGDSNGSYHEKGVDVRMAVDLVAGACDDLYDVAIIVSSDLDLLPAIQYARQKGKVVKYCGLKKYPTLGLTNNSSDSILLTKEELEQFISSST